MVNNASQIEDHADLHYNVIRLLMRQDIGNNNDLIKHLRIQGAISSDAIANAMKLCPRNLFVPQQYEQRALVDYPIRVSEHNFNISAPHIHASFLEFLDIKPGDKVLDVGAGCGVVTAYMSILAGESGEVVGIEVDHNILALCESNLRAWKDQCSPSVRASVIRLDLQNVFLPSRHEGQYDKVHIGASCPRAKVPQLLSLLKPTGGKIVAPIDADMTLINVARDGSIQEDKVTEVRFSDLTVPTDAEIVLSHLSRERDKLSYVQVPESTYETDITTIQASSWTSQTQQHNKVCGSPTQESDESGHSEIDWKGKVSPQGNELAYLRGQQFGQTDCALLVHSGDSSCPQEFPAHKAVLNARSEHFRARFASGMRDSQVDAINVPEEFSSHTTQLLLYYLYHDDVHVDIDDVDQLLRIAAYYGVQRLQVLCEGKLADELYDQPISDGVSTALDMLMLADAEGLTNIRTVALQYIVRYFPQASSCPTYQHLGTQQVDAIARELSRELTTCTGLLQQLSGEPEDTQMSSPPGRPSLDSSSFPHTISHSMCTKGHGQFTNQSDASSSDGRRASNSSGGASWRRAGLLFRSRNNRS